MRTLLCLLFFCLIASAAYATTPPCVLPQISPGGDIVATRFLPAPPARVREVITDSMQAAGVLLFKNTEQIVEGERVDERIKALDLPGGDEAVRAELTSASQEGMAGTHVRVETLRRAHKKGVPRQSWSGTILDQAACLVSLLSIDDPAHRPKLPAAAGTEIRLPDSTSLSVRSRHFLFSADLSPNRLIPFETAEDVVVDGVIVVPAGSLVVAYLENSSDIGNVGRGAKGQLRFAYLSLPDGTHVRLGGIVDFQGKGRNKALIIARASASTAGVLGISGYGFAIPAGTLFHAEVDGAASVHVTRASASSKSQD